MNHKLCSLLIATAVLVGANALSAQILLDDFSSFASPNTLFFGDWSLSGDPFSGDPAATATFSQGVGFYNFASGSDADSSYVERTFGSVRNLSGQNFLMVSSRLLPGNTADSFTVFLVDAGANTAFAVFATSDFNAAGFNTGSAALTADIGFALDEVTSFRLSGNDPFASATLSVAIDNLVASASAPFTAVPEPSTYGVLSGLGLLALGLHRRRSISRARRNRSLAESSVSES